MPFLSGSCSFVRFAVNAARPRVFGDEHLEKLREHKSDGAASRIATEDGAEIGWTAGDHVLDTDFNEMKQVWPDHLAWELLVKTNKLPADLMKAYYEVELKALTRDNPSGFPSARQKHEAKEAARERLEDEAKDGRFIKRKEHGCLWDGLRNELFFASNSPANCDRVMVMFAQTFGAELSIITAGSLAIKLYPQAVDERLSPFVKDVTPNDQPEWNPSESMPNFLGNEFLLWLWHYSDTEGDTIEINDTSITFMFTGGVNVEDPRGQTGRCTANSDSAVRLPESLAAIQHGKLPRKAGLTLVVAGEQFSFVIQPEILSITNCTLPKPPEDLNTERDRKAHRLQAIHDLTDTIELLYAEFLRRRLSPAWILEQGEIESWLKRAGRRATV